MTVRRLDEIAPADAAGAKASSLAALRRAGVRVPDGLVVLGDAFEEGRLLPAAGARVAELAAGIGAAAFAVRSSATLEDLPHASFAGRYLTLLGVGPADLPAAIARVRASGAGADVAVLVQPMLDASAAGVAFGADPLTGERGVVVVSAVPGLGDAVVGGRSDAEEWREGHGAAERVRGPASRVLDDVRVREIAAVARRIAAERDAPQDLEWAIAGGLLFVLQARPMTALPAAARWEAPPGAFSRTFRLGEWIGDPVTPLFESWLLTVMERTMHDDFWRLVGQPAPTPLHVVVNGWYYYSLNYLPTSIGAVLRMLPGILRRLPRDARRIAPVFPPLARFGVDLYVKEWREDLLPAYREATAAAAAEVERAGADRLVALIDGLAALAGHYFTSITFVAGYGWKTEIPLAQFYRRHLAARVGGDYRALLRGSGSPGPAAHAAHALDWAFPTLGELGRSAAAPPDPERTGRDRDELERRSRAALGGRERERFGRLLVEARRAASLREEQVADLTLPWPVFRRALRRLGEDLVARGVIDAADDIHFLRREEVLSALAGDPARRDVAARRAEWERRRRLSAPLVIGRLPRILEALLRAADGAMRDPAREPADGAVRGIPASGGRATGRARIVIDTDHLDRVEEGDVIVCRVMAPALAAIFDRAAAVVSDVGSPAAHASVLAREYGIPAVVGTGDGTARIEDASVVTVDGGAGLVWTVERP